jgi:DNA-binding MarR family transcriptional regulator
MPKSRSVETHGLDRSPSHQLHRALQLALDIYAEETGPGAVTQRQYAVLAAVSAEAGQTQSSLVRATGIDRSTLADMVARMIEKGLLDRQRSATDARANTVALTPEGRLALEQVSPRVDAADARILTLISAGKRETFLKLLRDFVKAAEQIEAPEKAKTKASKAGVSPAVGEAGAKSKKKAAKPDKKKKKKKKPHPVLPV